MSTSTVETSTFPTDDWDERTERFYTGEELDAPPDTRSELTPDERRRQEFGGVSVGAVFHGWLSALGVIGLLGGLVAAIGLVFGLVQDPLAGSPLTVGETTALTAGLVGAALALIGAFSGSYAAGRLVRFDGGRQGVVVWILLLVSAFVAAGLALVFLESSYALRISTSAPEVAVANDDLLLWGGVIVGLTLVLSLLAAVGGGKLGLRYHAKVERAGLDEATVADAAPRTEQADAAKPAKVSRREASREKRAAKKQKRATKKEAKQDAKRHTTGV